MLPDGAVVLLELDVESGGLGTYETRVLETGNDLWRESGSDELVGGGGGVLVGEGRIDLGHGGSPVDVEDG